eukprot:m.457042 g.457042  ORF g.457042 m.457042 type:complete len:133 (-) comp21176_c0_seq1:309-707(-)
MKEAGLSVGIDFTGKCDRSPNTLLSHVLMDFALKTTNDNNALAERLFKAYFTDGIYPDLENLVTLAAEVGLDPEAARAHMSDQTAIEAVQAEVMKNSRSTNGVPFFIMNDIPAFSGAQDPATFLHAFAQVSK